MSDLQPDKEGKVTVELKMSLGLARDIAAGFDFESAIRLGMAAAETTRLGAQMIGHVGALQAKVAADATAPEEKPAEEQSEQTAEERLAALKDNLPTLQALAAENRAELGVEYGGDTGEAIPQSDGVLPFPSAARPPVPDAVAE